MDHPSLSSNTSQGFSLTEILATITIVGIHSKNEANETSASHFQPLPKLLPMINESQIKT